MAVPTFQQPASFSQAGTGSREDGIRAASEGFRPVRVKTLSGTNSEKSCSDFRFRTGCFSSFGDLASVKLQVFCSEYPWLCADKIDCRNSDGHLDDCKAWPDPTTELAGKVCNGIGTCPSGHGRSLVVQLLGRQCHPAVLKLWGIKVGGSRRGKRWRRAHVCSGPR